MRRWLISAAALALAVTLMGQPVLHQPLPAQAQDNYPEGFAGYWTSTGYPVIDFAPEKPTGPAQISDPIARVMVRFDDGRVNQYAGNQIQAFLRRGIPVTLCLNANSIGTAGKMSWNQVRTLQEYARSNGTTLHIAQHTNSNFPTPNLSAHDEIVAEFETSVIFRETGYRPRAALLPGDGNLANQWFRRNRGYANGVTDSLGLWFTFAEAHKDSSTHSSFSPSLVNMEAYGSSEGNYSGPHNFTHQLKPGMGITRFEIPYLGAFDLGSFVVERVASDINEYVASGFSDTTEVFFKYGREGQTGVKPPRSDGWTFVANGGSPATDTASYISTLAWLYGSALQGNYGFQMALHDSAATVASTGFSGISGAEYMDGAVSPDHIAWVLAMLQKKGHIKLVGVEEFAEWVTGEWAPGTELIGNPRMLIPQFDIGDTLGATSEFAKIRGFSSIGRKQASPDSNLYAVRWMSHETAGGTVKHPQVGPRSAHQRIGDVVEGVRGLPGGVQIASSGGYTRLQIGHGDLPPGRYVWSVSVKSGGDISSRGVWAAQKVKGYKMRASMATGGATAYNDTLLMYMYKDDTQSAVLTGHTNRFMDIQYPFEFPDSYLGATTETKLQVIGQTDESTDATLMHPYGAAASEFYPLVSSARWAFTMLWEPATNSVWTNPRLVYLGK